MTVRITHFSNFGVQMQGKMIENSRA